MDNSSAISKNPAGLSCKSPLNCSPSVGLLKIREGGDTRECMGSLIGDDLLLTASHCLPENLRRPGARCKGQIQAQFAPTRNFPELRTECKEVVSASILSDRTLAQQDYAVLRLSKATNRPALEIDHSGFENNTAYTMIRAEGGLISTKPCRAIHSSEALPGSDQAESSVIAVADCDSTASSDGAPLLDSSGKLRGLYQAQVPPARIAKKASARSNAEQVFASISYATNFSCVRLPGEDDVYAFPSACQTDPNESSFQSEYNKSQNLISQCTAQTDTQFQWPQLSSELEWRTQAFLGSSHEGQAVAKALKLSPRTVSIFAIPFPKCLSSTNAQSVTEFSLPVVGYEYTLNRYLVLGVDSGKPLDSVRARLEVDLPHWRWGESGDAFGKYISLFIDTGSGGWVRVLRAPISTCSQTNAE